MTHITSVGDVENFFDYLLNERKVSFHPDEDFANYICLSTREPSFNDSEVLIFNRLMEESFDVCEKEGIDIYEIGLDKFTNMVQSCN